MIQVVLRLRGGCSVQTVDSHEADTSDLWHGRTRMCQAPGLRLSLPPGAERG